VFRFTFNYRIICVLLTGQLSLPLFAHSDGPEGKWKPASYPSALAHAPLPLPDRVVLTWAGDPANSQAVTWRTDTSIVRAVAEIAIAGNYGPKMKARGVPASTEPFTSDIGEAHYHSVNFTNLKPATLYAYRVGDGVNWTEWFHFRTASKEELPFSFIYFGDAQTDLKTHWSRVFREAFRDAPRAAFTLHAGDLINRANRDVEWGEWFGAPAWVNATIPVVPSPGNHEHFVDEDNHKARTLTRHWRPQFTLPVQNPPAGLEETCYFFDYQGARIISLDSNKKQSEQVAWLRGVLSRDPRRWTIVTFHHPIFSPAKNRDNPTLRELWKPVFDEFKVDLVLTGHDHTYARSGDVSAKVGIHNLPSGYSQSYDPKIGTVYVVSVSGPKMYPPDPSRNTFAVRVAKDTQLYQIVHVTAEELRYEARTATGERYDAFMLKKRAGKPNELMEVLPQGNRMIDRLPRAERSGN
jgi:3',5'-cyclic AMP phosphodiesterase CpdA